MSIYQMNDKSKVGGKLYGIETGATSTPEDEYTMLSAELDNLLAYEPHQDGSKLSKDILNLQKGLRMRINDTSMHKYPAYIEIMTINYKMLQEAVNKQINLDE